MRARTSTRSSAFRPTVAIEQRTSRGGRKSTVATLTEIYHFLRLLFVKLGTQYCPDCDVADRAAERRRHRRAHPARLPRQRIGLLAPLVVAPQGLLHRPGEVGARQGLRPPARRRRFMPTDQWPRLDRFHEHTIELPVADCVSARRQRSGACARPLLRARCDFGKGVVHVPPRARTRLADAAGRSATRHRARDAATRVLDQARLPVMRRAASRNWIRGCSRSTPSMAGAAAASAPALKLTGVDWDDRAGEDRLGRPRARLVDEWLEIDETCPACDGRRLNPEALAVRYRGPSIADLNALPVAQVELFFATRPRRARSARSRATSSRN